MPHVSNCKTQSVSDEGCSAASFCHQSAVRCTHPTNHEQLSTRKAANGRPSILRILPRPRNKYGCWKVEAYVGFIVARDTEEIKEIKAIHQLTSAKSSCAGGGTLQKGSPGEASLCLFPMDGFTSGQHRDSKFRPPVQFDTGAW